MPLIGATTVFTSKQMAIETMKKSLIENININQRKTTFLAALISAQKKSIMTLILFLKQLSSPSMMPLNMSCRPQILAEIFLTELSELARVTTNRKKWKESRSTWLRLRPDTERMLPPT